MKNSLFQKCAVLGGLALLLMIPLSMVESTIEERSSHREQAIASIAASTAGEQSLVGPVLLTTVTEDFDDEKISEENGERKVRYVRSRRVHTLETFPRSVHLDGALQVEKRAYGLHETAVYELQGKLSGVFEPPTAAALPTLGRNATLTWGKTILAVGVADARGVSGEPRIEFAGEVLRPRAGSRLSGVESGFHAVPKDMGYARTEPLPFTIDVRLVGTGSLGFVPLGESTTAELRGNWRTPSFGGDFLPRSRTVSDAGFAARWASTGLAQQTEGARSKLKAAGFQVRFIDPVDVYRQALRAVKYGILFIVLAFAAFFAFEHLKALPIHPIQYLFVGLAQAVFFLLLTSLSEHIAFAWAYAAASVASVLLIGAYLASILGRWQRGIGFSAGLAALYGALFAILRSDDNAFLLGSLLLFAALAALMLATRHIDWYALGLSKDADAS